MPSPPIPQTVLIIGGSLSGLMHALTLLSLPKPPQKITILERSPTTLLHNQGAGIVAGPEVQKYIFEYLKPPKDKEMVITSRKRQYLNSAGEIVEGSIEEREQRMTSWDSLFHILRWRVCGEGSDYIEDHKREEEEEEKEGLLGKEKAEYLNNCTITSISEEQGVKVTYTHPDTNSQQTATADLLISADGASSTIRHLLLPTVQRTYCGYVAFRGTLPETQLSESAKTTFLENFTFYHSTGIQILAYLIPGPNGTTIPGERLLNWVWYCNYSPESPEFEDLMTDIHGRKHNVTLPVGMIRPHLWTAQKSYARRVLPPQFAEIVEKTEFPFIQTITDVISPRNSFFDGKVLLVGDALAGFRPHTAASTGQAAYDAMELGRWFRGEIDRREYEENVMEFAERVQRSGVVMGERSQFGRHPFAAG